AAALRTGWPVTRWLGRLRRDPLRRLRAGRDPVLPARPLDDAGRAVPTPGPTTIAQSQLANAVRALIDGVADEVPEGWRGPMRRVVTVDDRGLGRAVDDAVRSTGLPPVRLRTWWRLLGALQVAVTAALVAGLLWLGVLAALQYFRLPDPPMYYWHGFPLPTLLAIGGAVTGLLIAFVGRVFARIGARRRARQVRVLLGKRLAEVARTAVVEPLQEEIARLERVRSGLLTAGARL
ncbi:MAG: GTP-binding protein HSR1-related protein, partial [Frankiales bacterium]|nr:GTP-binding protein HSR1-related protein [Frankiales bacterium]